MKEKNDCNRCNRGGSSGHVLPVEKRLENHIADGNAEIVAHIVLAELQSLSDEEKRAAVAEAAVNQVNRLKGYNVPFEEKWINSKEKKAKALANSKKEGNALVKQLQSMYPFARIGR